MSYLIDWMQMTGRYFTVVMYLLIPFRMTGVSQGRLAFGYLFCVFLCVNMSISSDRFEKFVRLN